ncbi:unnamed protein product [Calypogeia fissa]
MVRRCQDDADWQKKSSGVMFPGRKIAKPVNDGTLERKGVPVPQLPPSSAPARQERPQRWGLARLGGLGAWGSYFVRRGHISALSNSDTGDAKM